MHSFSSCLVHCVWSTKDRAPLLDSNLRSRLWPYFGGIARENKMKALAVGGAADHVHILVSLPTTLSVAKAIQLLKGNSSKWIHERFRGTGGSSGSPVTEHSASRYQAWQRRRPTFIGRTSIIRRGRFATNSKRCCKSITWSTPIGCWIENVFRP